MGFIFINWQYYFWQLKHFMYISVFATSLCGDYNVTVIKIFLRTFHSS